MKLDRIPPLPQKEFKELKKIKPTLETATIHLVSLRLA